MVCPLSLGLIHRNGVSGEFYYDLRTKLVFAGGREWRAGNAFALICGLRCRSYIAPRRAAARRTCGYMEHACVKCAPHKPTSRALFSDLRSNTRKAICGHSEHV